ncbi:hypothetical protein L0668_03915 [Paraglaciecola aquimarina]|uniref:DUF2069 domain-containing protein n=1 Tax=Paraglaciecola algarum TaxID=3050085 RepID=A0ABS9D2V4_9ALTE|nr:hypothetical protein [Paraglaciecola sp. G1-23]MCF2947240.1 hypothetical protein [Paraglaciecola sp. G1-23]
MKKISGKYGVDWLMATFALIGMLAVLQTFIIGKHFIIPTLLLVITIVLGNLAWYGFKQLKWAQYVNFWCISILTSHCFFALFWAKKYRELLGSLFEPVAIVVTILLFLLSWFYARNNQLFSKT